MYPAVWQPATGTVYPLCSRMSNKNNTYQQYGVLLLLYLHVGWLVLFIVHIFTRRVPVAAVAADVAVFLFYL